MNEVVGCQPLTAWLMLSVVECVVSGQHSTDHHVDCSVPLPTKEEKDVLSYIGGFIVRRVMRSYHEVGKTFVSGDDPETDSLTGALSRGGLLNLKGPARTLFIELEIVFRRLFPRDSLKCTMHRFVEEALSDTTVRDSFHDLTHLIENDAEGEGAMCLLLNCFFTVRIHQQCHNVVEEMAHNKKISKKDKSL